MSLEKVIRNTSSPQTKERIAGDLRKLGLREGMIVLVHSSLSSLGFVNGGAITVIQALMEVVTEHGTIVMPSQSTDLSDPSEWNYPPVPKEWWQTIRDSMPAYHEAYTPTRGMGKIVEVFRTFPGVMRSSHPNYSFVAWGKAKEEILAGHSLHFGLGESSPLRKLYDRDSFVLQLGTSFETCTCFHLAEYRIARKKMIQKGAPIIVDGKRVWTTYQELEFREELFEKIGQEFEQQCPIILGTVGSATCRIFSLPQAVDFAINWLNKFDNQ